MTEVVTGYQARIEKPIEARGLGENAQPFDLIRIYTARVVAKIIKYISRQIFPQNI